jgi:hypothetical protein
MPDFVLQIYMYIIVTSMNNLLFLIEWIATV